MQMLGVTAKGVYLCKSKRGWKGQYLDLLSTQYIMVNLYISWVAVDVL